MTQSRTETLILMLMAIVILLMVAIGGLFFQMIKLQEEVLSVLSVGQAAPPLNMGLATGTPATDFDLVATDGQPASLSDWAGQTVLLMFSSTGCPACREMYPDLKAFSERHPEVQTVMVSRGTDEENRQLVKAQGFAFPVLTGNDAVAGDYLVPGTPFFYVLDGQGIIVNKGFANSLEQLEALVKDGGG